jgi:hypothetical protein
MHDGAAETSKLRNCMHPDIPCMLRVITRVLCRGHAADTTSQLELFGRVRYSCVCQGRHCDKTGSLHSVYNMSTKCFVDTFVDLFCRMLLFL